MNTDLKPLATINVHTARVGIKKAIAEYRRLDRLAVLMREFFSTLQGKRINRGAADKLQIFLQEKDPELLVYRVQYGKHMDATGHLTLPTHTFIVSMYEMPRFPGFFTLRDTAGVLDIDGALAHTAQWKTNADFLESKLERFAYHAGKFNEAVKLLSASCLYAVPVGQTEPVYPLSQYMQWDLLAGADGRIVE